MSDKELVITTSPVSEAFEKQEEQVVDDSSQETQTPVTPKRKQSTHSFRVIESKESESDKDLIIHSLNESLHIHKEILERIQNEKEAYHQQIEKEREIEKQKADSWRKASEHALEEQLDRCAELEYSISKLRRELEVKKEDYKKLEVKFYSYVKQIRVTDDDLSTIQPEISHLLSQLNNTCMGLKSKMNREQGTLFVLKHWEHRADQIKKHMIPSGSDGDLLDTSCITFFVEKYLINILLKRIMDVPIHLGVSINDSFKEVNEWMINRNKEWSNRLRQQVCALVVQQPGDEEEAITRAKQQLLEEIVEELHPVYPPLKQDPKKIENLISRASKLNLAIKGQEIKIERLPIEEGVTRFNTETMKATAKGKPDGIVFLSITPTFIARDEVDNEHGFTIPGKVFCVEQVNDDMEEDDDNDDQQMQEVVEDVEEQISSMEKSDNEMN
ncbi:hypothetical protein BD560DRAFT_385657 [Blakeslea trispora]|nr:hypothetical protein BD560DRAFT_385657 [Blakeslea trispora]